MKNWKKAQKEKEKKRTFVWELAFAFPLTNKSSTICLFPPKTAW